MSNLSFTLVCDGSSDKSLVPALVWVLGRHSKSLFTPQWPDLGRVREPPRLLRDKLRLAVDLAPCDLLFVHRDAEREPAAKRFDEIKNAVTACGLVNTVPVVPVRMTEAWLTWHEQAIRSAVDNPSGRVSLDIPKPSEVDALPDPKDTLHQLMRRASEARGRRLKELRPEIRQHRLADLIDDFTPLLKAPAFATLDSDVREIVQQCGW